jgi:hypothetical protein
MFVFSIRVIYWLGSIKFPLAFARHRRTDTATPTGGEVQITVRDSPIVYVVASLKSRLKSLDGGALNRTSAEAIDNSPNTVTKALNRCMIKAERFAW